MVTSLTWANFKRLLIRHSSKIVVWLQLSLLLFTTMSYQCADQIEPQPVTGFDIQIYYNPNDYRSLYVHKNQTDFVLIFQGIRNTGQLTEADHTRLINLLSEEDKKILMNKSILQSDSINYPYLSIKERHKENSSDIADFFVILPLNSDEIAINQIIEVVEYIFTKYKE